MESPTAIYGEALLAPAARSRRRAVAVSALTGVAMAGTTRCWRAGGNDIVRGGGRERRRAR